MGDSVLNNDDDLTDGSNVPRDLPRSDLQPDSSQLNQLPPDSLSRSDARSQPADHGRSLDGNESDASPSAHVVLYHPEIPQNTGNIGRTCVAVNAKLWIVRPAGFQLDEKRLRRAGLDYWQHLKLGDANNWSHLTDQLSVPHQNGRFFYLSRFAKREIWEADFQRGDVLVFGSESGGLPDQILDTDHAHALRLPTSADVRSLNLATTAGVVLYEHMRQTRT
ncbi:tRNA (cytidine(34)-2'-O)-methyltransferase [Planctomycetes bacterium K23_9]|uniref:Putative tRNA (cytidine(34)-2'-O)-methyltransferase n=1 Tax=Stieleria marina TaxID=1930275 RepID=A0A517NUW0_9BACT|nr:tRNA (cytidine(34)-2'-O)-methyltransferase [Planctomycetes bacterium K23_9]